MKAYKAIQAFNEALRKTQEACKYIAPKDSDNPAFARGNSKGSRYASLTSVLQHAMPHALANGLTLSQRTEVRDEWVVLISVLSHDEGHSVTSEWPVARVTEKPQALGSALTYAKRYQTTCLFGLSADEDDDGNGANKSREENERPPQRREEPQKRAVGVDSNSKPDDGVARMLMAFGRLGLKADEIEEYVGRPLDQVTEEDRAEMRQLYSDLEAGRVEFTAALDHKLAERARKGNAA